MSPELAAGGDRAKNWRATGARFARWDPRADRRRLDRQVHRAITLDGRAVAVKVQYPGIAETMAADLRQRRAASPDAAHRRADPGRRRADAELRDRVREELDYRHEAANQRLLAAYYEGHPTIRIPAVIGELSTRRVVTSELADGARFAELASLAQHERDLAAETIYRFVFRSLYDVHAFNGDPHPGNYLFHGGGRVTFLDFGLVKHFTPAELQPLMQMARTCASATTPRRSAAAWRTPASCARARR